MRRYFQMLHAPLHQPLQGQAITHIYENVTFINILVGGKHKLKYRIMPLFDPFTGPLSGYMKTEPEKKVKIPEGVILGHDDLWSMQWFVDWVVYLGAGG